MTPERLLSDLSIWWIQAAIVGGCSAFAAAALRLPAGRTKLLYWQSALLACLLLPLAAMRPSIAVTVSHSIRMVGSTPIAATPTDMVTSIPWAEIALASVAAGIAVRLMLFLFGFARLRRYKAASVPLEAEISWAAEADLRLSDNVAGPVTFGIRKPVILLPVHFSLLPAASQDAILCHEVLHVRRRDWLFAVAEELVRAALWFQPAIWWIVNEIQLAREQTVDAAVVRMLNQRDEYVDALLTASGAEAMTDLASAPLFLRKRQLKRRLISILKEHSMSKTQRISTFALSFALLAITCWAVITAFPLTASAQMVNDAQGVTVNTNGALLVHRSGVPYPAEAASKGVEGTVQIQVTLDGAGNVTDAAVIAGPDALRKAALRSVLDWHFIGSGGTRQVGITFAAPAPGESPQTVTSNATVLPQLKVLQGREQTVQGSPRIVSISVMGISEEAKQQLLARLPFHEGDRVSSDGWGKMSAGVREFDEHLNTLFMATSPDEVRVVIGGNVNGPSVQPVRRPVTDNLASGEQLFRVGGAVQAANLVRKVTPVYPELAKVARVQGTVQFDALIGKDGTIENLSLVSGPPLLVQAAMTAVQQWQYKPTTLSGEPVRVATTIDVNFTLSE